MREFKVEDRLVDGVVILGGTCSKFVTPGMVGAPDRIIVWPVNSVGYRWLAFNGYIGCQGDYPFVEFVETKTPDDAKPKIRQVRYHQRLRAQGLTVTVLPTFELVDSWLDLRGRSPKKVRT